MEPLTKLHFAERENGRDCAVLRLRAGASPFPHWTFNEYDQGLEILIGSDPSCDWRILSAGVHEQELQVYFSGRALLVRSMRPRLGARVNGARLEGGWTPLENGARIEMGLASIEVSIPAQNADASPGNHPSSAPLTTQLAPERDHAARIDDWERAREQAEQAAVALRDAKLEAQRWKAADGSTHQSDLGSRYQAESLRPQTEFVRYVLYVATLGLVYALWVLGTGPIGH